MISTYVLDGHTTHPASASCALIRRLPLTAITGLSAASVRETGTRVREAVVSSGYDWPRQRVELALSQGTAPLVASTGVDLALSLAALVASGQVEADRLDGLAFWGELSMAGEVRTVRGTLAAARAAQAQGLLLVTSPEGAARAARAGLPAASLPFLAAVRRSSGWDAVPVAPMPEAWPERALDFRDVVIDEAVCDGLVEAARARRPVLFVGPPGCGKTMIAARLPEILPLPSAAEQLEIATVADAVGLGSGVGRPFRAPHHTISRSGLVGAGGRFGELALARHGVLFLDALLDWPRATLVELRHARTGPDAPWLVLATEDGHEEGSTGHDRLLRHLDALGIDPVWIVLPRVRAAGGGSIRSADLRARVMKEQA